MKGLFLSLSVLLTTLPAFAADPWLYKVAVERSTNGRTCGDDAKAIYSKLEGGVAAALFGWPGPIFFDQGEGCRAAILFSSKNLIEPKVFSDAFAEGGFTILYIVDNRPATYLGYTAIATVQDGSSAYCKRKGSQLLSFPSWIEGYTQLDREISSVQALNKEAQLNWIDQQFSCGDLGFVKSVAVVFDLTNAASCELNGDTNRTCFILRGLQKYEFSFNEKSANFEDKN